MTDTSDKGVKRCGCGFAACSSRHKVYLLYLDYPSMGSIMRPSQSAPSVAGLFQWTKSGMSTHVERGWGIAGDGVGPSEVDAAKAPQAEGGQQEGSLPDLGALDPGPGRETAGMGSLLEDVQMESMEELRVAEGGPALESRHTAEAGWFLLAGQLRGCLWAARSRVGALLEGSSRAIFANGLHNPPAQLPSLLTK